MKKEIVSLLRSTTKHCNGVHQLIVRMPLERRLPLSTLCHGRANVATIFVSTAWNIGMSQFRVFVSTNGKIPMTPSHENGSLSIQSHAQIVKLVSRKTVAAITWYDNN